MCCFNFVSFYNSNSLRVLVARNHLPSSDAIWCFYRGETKKNRYFLALYVSPCSFFFTEKHYRDRWFVSQILNIECWIWLFRLIVYFPGFILNIANGVIIFFNLLNLYLIKSVSLRTNTFYSFATQSWLWLTVPMRNKTNSLRFRLILAKPKLFWNPFDSKALALLLTSVSSS